MVIGTLKLRTRALEMVVGAKELDARALMLEHYKLRTRTLEICVGV